MTNDGVAIARAVLDRLEAGIAARDHAALADLCTGDVVLFGSSQANFGLAESAAYLRLVADENTVRWFLDRWSVVHADDAHVLVAATGEVESDDGSGPERFDFRLSLWLVQVDGEWRIGHFHGSVPQG